jgi:hypothetical protein
MPVGVVIEESVAVDVDDLRGCRRPVDIEMEMGGVKSAVRPEAGKLGL